MGLAGNWRGLIVGGVVVLLPPALPSGKPGRVLRIVSWQLAVGSWMQLTTDH
jgi:hypothetical protein